MCAEFVIADRRQRIKCGTCGETAIVKFTEQQSRETRIIYYQCKTCNLMIKTIEQIVEAAEFKAV